MSYDEILLMNMLDNNFLVGYANDTLVFIVAQNTEDKTEYALLTKRHILAIVEVRVGSEQFKAKRYLG